MLEEVKHPNEGSILNMYKSFNLHEDEVTSGHNHSINMMVESEDDHKFSSETRSMKA